jgi:hypothetical protein
MGSRPSQGLNGRHQGGFHYYLLKERKILPVNIQVRIGKNLKEDLFNISKPFELF